MFRDVGAVNRTPRVITHYQMFVIAYTHLLGCFVPSGVSCCSCDCFGIVLLFLEGVFEFFPNLELFPSELYPLRLLLEHPIPCAEAEPRTSDDCRAA